MLYFAYIFCFSVYFFHVYLLPVMVNKDVYFVVFLSTIACLFMFYSVLLY